MDENRCNGCMQPMDNVPVCPHCGYPANAKNASHQLPAGTILRDQYLIGRVLGQGGFGITYLGWDRYLETPVAIKEYFPSGMVMRETSLSLDVNDCGGDTAALFQHNRERFLREARTLAKFAGVPQIVRVQNLFLANNTAYIVMEYVQGITLKQYVARRGGRLGAEETFAILRPVMEALTKVHDAGLVHRDISPDNIMMLPGGGAKLLDFGAVRDVGAANVDKALTRSTEAILKHGFAPMEQYQKRGSLGPWTDVYALCATIYFCLTGEVPADAPERMMGENEVRWDGIPGLTPERAKALERGMALLPKNRTGSIAELYGGLYLYSQSYAPPVRQPIPPQSGTYAAHTVSLREEREEHTVPVKPQQPKQETPKTAPAPQKPVEKQKITAPKKPLALLAAIAAAVVLVCCLVLFAGRDAGTPAATEAAQAEAGWETNLLRGDRISLSGAQTPTVLGSDIVRKDILRITFLATLKNAPEDSWDVSEAQNGTVLAWVEPNGDDYNLFIAGEGGINGRNACEKLFAEYWCVTRIDFNDCFHTEGAESMSYMFRNCKQLKSLDLGCFDTTSVTNMMSMFEQCSNLTELNVRSFDTSRVTNMHSMFYQCSNLEKLDLTHFDTSSVVHMEAMFRSCSKLKSVYFGKFDITNVVTYNRFMEPGMLVNGRPWEEAFE